MLLGHLGRREPYGPLTTANIIKISACKGYPDQECGQSDQEYVEQLADELERTIESVGAGRICALVVETVVRAVGFPA